MPLINTRPASVVFALMVSPKMTAAETRRVVAALIDDVNTVCAS